MNKLCPRPPTLQQIRAFVAVVRHGQFTRAAHELGVSQSALSEAIRDLEAVLTVRLLDRHTRKVQLTTAGAEFLDVAQKLVQELDEAVHTMRATATLARGRVVMAALGLQSALLLPARIAEFSARWPSVEVVLHDVPEYEAIGLVQSGVADIGLVTANCLPDDLRAKRFDRDHFVVILAPDHDLARRRVLTWDDLQGQPLIGLKTSSPTRQALDRALATYGIHLHFDHEVSMPLTIVGLVQAGFGVALTTSVMQPLAQWMGLLIRPLTGPRVERDLVLIHSRDRSLAPAAQKLYAYLLRNPRSGRLPC